MGTKLGWHYIPNLVLMIALCTACVSHSSPTPGVDQSTPEKAIRSLSEAFIRGDALAVAALVYPGDTDGADLVRGFQAFVAKRGVVHMTDLEIDVVANDGKVARARTRYYNKVMAESGEIILEGQTGSLYTLMRKEGRWYFVGLGQQVPPGWIDDAGHTPVWQQGVR
jgi:hypothetical protein